MPNPYTLLPVDAPEYFVAAHGGRGAQAASILQHILRVNPRPDPVSLVGERRFGKSSLLRYLEQRIAGTPNLLAAYVDLLSLSPQTPAGFYGALTESMIWAEALPDTSPGLDYSSFRSFLYGLRKNRQRLVLFIDEFDLVARDRRFDPAFFDNLRSLVTSFPLTLVVASVAPLAEMAHQDVFASPFWNVFIKERLWPLSLQEAEALVLQDGSPDGLGDVKDDIIQLAGRHPFFLQFACSIAWKLRTEGQGHLDLKALRSTFDVQVRDHYQYIWEHSTSQEQQELCALAHGAQPGGAGLMTLIERGYVGAEGQAQNCGEGFAIFLRTQCSVQPSDQDRGQPGSLPDPLAVPAYLEQSRWASEVPERRLALVVGINNYLHQEAGDYYLAPLQYAEHDAAEMAALLAHIGFEVMQLTGAQATYGAIQAKFEEWSQAIVGPQHPESRFIFHFSGHGMIDPHHNETAYLSLYNTDPSNPATAGLEMNHLVYGFLPKVPLRHTLVLLDACHAGFAAGVKHVRPDSRRLSNVTQQVFGIAPGRMVLAACPGGAQAREFANLEHGVFTYYILRHWRDLDEPHPPDRITFGSLVDYVGSKMPNHYPQLPLPVYSGIGMGGTFTLFHIVPGQNVQDKG